MIVEAFVGPEDPVKEAFRLLHLLEEPTSLVLPDSNADFYGSLEKTIVKERELSKEFSGVAPSRKKVEEILRSIITTMLELYEMEVGENFAEVMEMPAEFFAASFEEIPPLYREIYIAIAKAKTTLSRLEKDVKELNLRRDLKIVRSKIEWFTEILIRMEGRFGLQGFAKHHLQAVEI